MALTSPSRDLYHLQNNSSYYLPFISPTVTPSHEDSDPYFELQFIPFLPHIKIDLGTTRIREPKSCKLNIFNPKDTLMNPFLAVPNKDSGVLIETLRLPITEAEHPAPNLKDCCFFHLPPNSSALIRITWTPVTPDDLYTSLVFKWGRFTSKVVLYGKVEVVARKSQRVLFGDTQTSNLKQHITSVFRAPLSSLGINSPPVDKKSINPVSSHTFLDVDDSALSLPSQSFIASTPMDRNATRVISTPADHTFVHPSVIKRFPPRSQDVSMVAAARCLSFGQTPGAGAFDSQWADKQISAFTFWLNFVLCPPDSSNFTSIQADNSPPAKRYSINLTSSFRGVNSTSDTMTSSGEPKYTVTQRKYLNHLRSNMQALSIDPLFTSVLYSLHAEVEKSRIKIRPEKPVWKDVGLKEDLLRTLLSYHPLWLRLGLEVVFNCRVPVTHEMDSRTIHKFLTLHLFSSRNISAKFSHRKVPGLFTKGYDMAISKHIVFKYYSLVLFLDQAKQKKLINHDPCLFRGSRIKSSREMLLYFSSNFLQGEGDITKHLGNLGYYVSHKQSFLDEFDYKVKNLAVDLRDGMRLSRLLELLTQEWGISQRLRIPATSMNPKLANNKLFLDKLREVTGTDLGISGKDIAIGHKEKTLSLIWALIFHFRVAIKLDEFLLRREIAYIRAKHSIHEKCIPIKLTGNKESITLNLLLEWCSVICTVFGVQVTDFTSSFKDGRALCYILHYYHPSLLCKHFISADAKSNFEEFSQKLSSLGGVPTLPPPSDFQTGPNEKVVIMYVSYLCAQQLELTEEIRAAVVIQRAYRRYTYRQQQEQLEQSSYDSQLFEFRTQTQAAITIQSVYRGFLVRRQNHRSREIDDHILREKTAAALILQRGYRAWSANQLAIHSRRNYLSLRQIVISIQRTVRKNAQVKKQIFLPLAEDLVHNVITASLDSATREYQVAALTIQSAYRGYKARKELNQLKANVIRHVEYLVARLVQNTIQLAYTSLNEDMQQSAVVIQSMYRAYRARREVTNLRSKRNELHLQMLKSVNSSLIDTRADELVHNILSVSRKQMYLEMEQSAIALQSMYRGMRARREVVNLRSKRNELHLQMLKRVNSSLIDTRADELVHSILCASRKHISAEKQQSAITLQSMYRGMRARRELSQLRKQDNGTSLCVVSSVIVERVINRAEDNLQRDRLSSAVRIQNCYRTWSANRLAQTTRDEYLFLRTCVVTVQRAVRRIIELKRFNSSLISTRADEIVHSILYLSQTQIYMELEKSVITLQSMYRGMRARKELSYLRRQTNESFMSDISNLMVERIITESKQKLQQERLSSAIRIQNCYRRWSATRLALSMRNTFLSLKSTVVLLQHCYRNHLEYKRQSFDLKLRILSDRIVDEAINTSLTSLSQEILSSIVTIQQSYRQYRANNLAISTRDKYVSMRNYTISVQRAFRKRRDANERLKRAQATLYIQSSWRSFIVRSTYIRQRSAAIRIQQTFRQCPTYRKNRQLERETAAAITIQSFFRGNLIRRHMQSSLVFIRHRLSDATKSADESDQLKNKIPKYLEILKQPSRSLAHKYDILDNLKTAVYVSESCAIRVRREGLEILYMLVDNNVRSPSIMQRVEKAADVLLQMTKWSSIANDIFVYGQSIPIIVDLLQKIYVTQPSTVRILCHLIIAFCKYPDQVATIHNRHEVSLRKMHKLLSTLKRKYQVGAPRMLGRARKDLAQSIFEMERVFTYFRYIT